MMSWLRRRFTATRGRSPSVPGLRDGRLPECPRVPRCVSTQACRSSRRVAPIGYPGPRSGIRAILVDVLRAWPRTEVVTADGEYIHAVQRSPWFGFADDLECHLPADERLVHIRSAARVGWYDFGVNRARVERLRRAVNQRLADIPRYGAGNGPGARQSSS